jgi:Carboxypeptidase regulatory-like domain
MRTCLRYIAFPGAILLLFARWSAWGQTTTTGSIAGVVADPSGAVVPDAKVALKNVARGATHAAVSSKQGEFRFDLLLPGPYSVTVTASGFQTAVRKVEVSVGSVSSLDRTYKNNLRSLAQFWIGTGTFLAD